MKIRAMIENPDNVNISMVITMNVEEWQEFEEYIRDGGKYQELASDIFDLRCSLRKVIYPEPKSNKTVKDAK